MPTSRILRHGFTAGVPPAASSHQRAKRQKVKGWSADAIRRNTVWLYGIDERCLTGKGLAVTLTVRDCPETAKEWHAARVAFTRRLERMGMLRMHWVVEWQRRGVPHLHCAVWFPDDATGIDIIGAWAAVAGQWGVADRGQHITRIRDVVGWNQYVSKHASRGLSHYQRSPEYVPAGWRGNGTGRVWGYRGDWPARDAERYEVCHAGLYAIRRIHRKRAEASARAAVHAANEQGAAWASRMVAEGDRRLWLRTHSKAAQAAHRRLTWARKRAKVKPHEMHAPGSHAQRDHQRRTSQTRGVSEWVPASTTARIFQWLGDQIDLASGDRLYFVAYRDDDARGAEGISDAPAARAAPSRIETDTHREQELLA